MSFNKKIVHYMVLAGEKNIQQYIDSGMQPWGNPWREGRDLFQVLVRYEESKCEVEKAEPKTVIKK